jgi:predicted nucleic acid-binding protein
VGLILDSSVAVAAQRRGDTIQAFLQRVIETAGDQGAALSPVSVVELVHGIHHADTAERRARRELDAEQQSRGIVVPFADLLIGATALSLGYSVLTVNAATSGASLGCLSFNFERAGIVGL